jgi:RimJ/RimL family protein N-acetyltransferase
MNNPVSLRAVTEDDLPIFFANQLDPDSIRMADFPPRERDVYMAHWARVLKDENNITQTILFNGQVAGNLMSWEQDGQRYVGYWLGKEFWGQGIATTALTAFLKIVTTRPLVADVAKHNIASRRVLEKCGFTVYEEEDAVYLLKLI